VRGLLFLQVDLMKGTIIKNAVNRKYEIFWPIFFLAPFFIFFLGLNIYPIVYSFFISLTDWTGINEKTFIGLGNYIKIISGDGNFRKSIGNTFYIILIANSFTLILALLLANFLFGLKRGRTVFQTLNFLPYVTTPVALGLLFQLLFDWKYGTVNVILTSLGILKEGVYWLGMANTAPLVVIFLIVWKYVGYYMAIFLAGLTTIPEELYEAAVVDGAGKRAVFFRITIPILRPILTFASVTSLIGGLQIFDEPTILFTRHGNMLFGGPDRSVLTIVWNFYDIAFRNEFRMGYGAAVAFLLFLIIVTVSFIGTHIVGGREE
jgi:multiple sugar transport system permease protein/cellobiose transport system permease protein